MSNLIITANNIEDFERYAQLEKVRIIVVGNDKFSNRVSKTMTLKEIGKCCAICQSYGKDVYVTISKLFHESQINELEEYIETLLEYDIQGIIFSDFAVYEIVKKLNSNINLMYNTDTTITNSSFTDLAKEFGIEAVFLAKELSLREIKEINQKKATPIVMFIHGHIYMYNSFRKLISEYFSEIEESISISDKKFYLYDEERELKYPIVENEEGVNILAAKDLMAIKYLYDILESEIDYLFIDGYLYNDEDYIYILKCYNKLLEIYIEVQNFKKPKEYFDEIAKDVINSINSNIKYKEFSTGFLLKETIF